MNTNYLKLFGITLSSSLFLSSLPVNSQSSKSSIIHNHPEQDYFTTNLVAQSYGEALKVIKKVIVRKNGGLTIIFTEPVELLSGSVVINSPNMTLEYLVKNAKIGKKSISWGGGGGKFPQDKLLRVDTSNLSGYKEGWSLRAPRQSTYANPAPFQGSRVLGFAKPVTNSAVTAASYGGLANPAAAAGLSSASALVSPAIVTGPLHLLF